ncbi:hypothetical protein NUW58_g6144 [Xylaria curta]|uniref:Uncharacterized protein n=1 Tax=Xylaria curta TaxID=42375 RepID=A0ACC1P010_9PEZI|nr:hypothetical protein NUW58_g6144 [Xylaria curta]
MGEIDITDNSNTWRHWDPIPPAYEPCKNDREEREYDLALSDPNRCFGQGIKDDPLVVWIDRPAYLNRSLVWAHNNFAKSIAKVLGFTHTWIIKGAHDRQYARDCKGRKIAIEADRWLVRDADMHITLRLGTDLYSCRLSAHAYVVLDEEGNPARYMTELARRFKASGAEPQLEFWRWENRHRRFLPRRPVSLGPNWEVHANVGPYLDTYRPDNRRTCDTYTPRRDDTPPRESSDDDDDENAIFEGAMTDELAEMVRRCNSAYEDYTEFHEYLVAIGEISSDQVVELLTMREQIVTMQREVYREAKGLIM